MVVQDMTEMTNQVVIILVRFLQKDLINNDTNANNDKLCTKSS